MFGCLHLYPVDNACGNLRKQHVALVLSYFGCDYIDMAVGPPMNCMVQGYVRLVGHMWSNSKDRFGALGRRPMQLEI